MTDHIIAPDELQFLSGQFTYPVALPCAADQARMGAAMEPAWGAESSNGSIEALQAEYVRLFINALPEVSCPPYGSFYIEGALMGESTVALRNLYRSYGFKADEMPDHVAVELEFLARLAAFRQQAPVGPDHEFLVDHLGRWLPRFLDRVEEKDEIDFSKRFPNMLGRCRQVILILDGRGSWTNADSSSSSPFNGGGWVEVKSKRNQPDPLPSHQRQCC